MWRFFLYLHIRRSERRRLIVAFGLPVAFWWGFLEIRNTWEESMDPINVGEFLDSLKAYQQVKQFELYDSIERLPRFRLDTLSNSSWWKLGMKVQDTIRLSRYQKAGGRIRSIDDLYRLKLGDSLWVQKLSIKLIIEPHSSSSAMAYESRSPSEEVQALFFNEMDDSTLESMHLAPWLKERWLSLLKVGRSIHSREEFLEVIKPDSIWFSRWGSSIVFEEPGTKYSLDLNSTDSSLLVNAQLFSSWEARKLIQYRDRLGGFVSLEQLFESGIDSNRFTLMKYINVELSSIKLRSINESDVVELGRHPYIGWKRAQSLDYYRKHVRPIQDIEELEGIEGWTKEDIERIQFYFK